MKEEESNKLLDHYFPDLDKKTRNRILRFAATYHRELREENQYLKQTIAYNLNQYAVAMKSMEDEIERLNEKANAKTTK